MLSGCWQLLHGLGVAISRRHRLKNSETSWALAKRRSKRSKRLVSRDWVAVFQPEFVEDLRYWVTTNRKVALRALDLVQAVLRDPFTGVGKPEPLKYLPSGTWSRRLTEEHRIVYIVSAGRIDFLQARYHY